MSSTSQQKPQQNGKFIVFEGGDSTGKHTQARLLLKYLKLKIQEIEFLSFPQYDSPFGALVAKYLRGEYGELHELPPEIPCLLYALDRYQVKEKLENGLSSGTWFIADRYTQSNFGYQGAKLDGEARKRLITWVECLESRLPQPDLVIYLHVPVTIAQKLMESREHKAYLAPGRMQDIHELDDAYQQRVVDTYSELAVARENWIVIECANEKNNELRSVESINNDIVQVVNEKLKF